MAIPQKKENYKYSYVDYITWPENERWEIIEGVSHNMSPAPSTKHQELLGELYLQLAIFLKDKPCKVFLAPFDVRLKESSNNNDEEVYTVVQPDLVVYCDMNKVDENGGIAAPDICVEILSPSTSFKDDGEKYKLYEKYGVKEYWIVNPVVESIVVFKHTGSTFDKPNYYNKSEILSSSVLAGLEINLGEVFI